ncbi:hypothetical protein [Nocardia sp. NRRL S-836]|uniref:hypothetical protein n=1 Tax=Nocardia sp. NRRL S-836 TaxID=1519492 RepID=UPI0006AEDD38|nr:hypothetical protein [Nocardia sp. NRRL S-836]KOV84754.1 hypothetical protein ADL03_15940 [Nocardia sp. NRRL S-836]
MTVVGYVYKGQLVCADEARELGITMAAENGYAMSWGDCGAPEETLGAWAGTTGLDREDETTFTTGEFPKRVTDDHAQRLRVEGLDTCCHACGWDLAQPF